MPNVSFFGGGYRDAARGATIKALEERQKAADAALLASMKPQEIRHPLQGIADVMGTVGAGIREGRIEAQAQAGRDQLAKLMAGGLTPDEYGQAMGLDPELAQKYIGHDFDVQAAKDRVAFDVQAAKDRVAAEKAAQEAGFQHADTAAATLAGTQATTRADEARIAEAKAKADQARTQETNVQEAALSPDRAKLAAALKAGTIDQAGYDAGMKGIADKEAADAAAARFNAMSPGTKQLDQDYVKDNNDWNSTGRAIYANNKAQLAKGIDILEKGKGDGGFWDTASQATGVGQPSGLVTGAMPDWAKRLTGNQGAITARDSIRSVAQESLKAVLGAQFAQVEGQQVLERAFDPSATPDENIRRVKLLGAKLDQIAAANEAKDKYWRENGGTLQGYTGPSLADTQADFLSLQRDFDLGGGADGSTAPQGTGGALPAGVTEDDITETMRANNMTRDQVLQKLKEGG